MATEWGDSLKVTGLVATGDLSANQFMPVAHASTAGAVKLSVAVTSLTVGILVNAPVSGEPAEIVACGNTKAKLAAGVAAGALLAPNSTGHLALAAGANTRIVGVALEASGGAGFLHPIFVIPSNL